MMTSYCSNPRKGIRDDVYSGSVTTVDTGKAVVEKRGGKGRGILIVSGVANASTKDHVNNVSLHFLKLL